jgi:vacuolar-type H+-ATPase subunit C/Vma6
VFFLLLLALLKFSFSQIPASYFAACLSEEDLDEMHIEIIRNTLYKAYLEDFNRFCQTLGGATSLVMGQILQFEADRRTINITINSFGTELSKDDRTRLFPEFGLLYPDVSLKLGKAEDIEAVVSACTPYGVYPWVDPSLPYDLPHIYLFLPSLSFSFFLSFLAIWKDV